MSIHLKVVVLNYKTHNGRSLKEHSWTFGIHQPGDWLWCFFYRGLTDMKCKSEVAFVTKHERKAENTVDHSGI